MMTPRPAARGFPLALVRAMRIALGRRCIVVRVIPIPAPLVNVVANVIEAEGVGRVMGYRLGAILPASRVIRERLRRLVAPGKIFLFEIAARSTLPFRLRWKTVAAAGLRTQPLAVSIRLEPGDAGDRLPRLIQMHVVPERRRLTFGRMDEPLVFRVGDLRGCEQESVDPDTVNGPFTILPRSGAHQKPGCGDRDEKRIE